jgi:ADP-heptose:LPS heptosyltransferase
MAKKPPENPKNILIIKIRALGDVLMTTPMIRAVRRKYPEAWLTVVVAPVESNILMGNPNIDELIIYDRNKIKKLPFFKKIGEYRNLISKLRRVKHDLLIDAHSGPRAITLAGLARAGFRIGQIKKQNIFYNIRLQDSNDPGLHSSESYLRLTGALGIPDDGLYPDVPRHPELIETVRKKLAEETGWREGGEKLALIHPGGGGTRVRIWPEEHFLELGRLMSAENNIKPVYLCGPSEKEFMARLDKENPAGIKVIRNWSIPELIELLPLADMLITSNNGIYHIAGALETPMIHLTGPMSVLTWGAQFGDVLNLDLNFPCSPCGGKLSVCPYNENRCLMDLKPEMVLKAAMTRLGS